MSRRKKLAAGAALVVGVSLAPLGAIAHQHEAKPAPKPAYSAPSAAAAHAAPAPAHDGMAGDSHAKMDDHHAAKMDDHHAAPASGHAASKPAHKGPRAHVGATEGGSGSSDNPGGSVADGALVHPHGDNQGGDIH